MMATLEDFEKLDIRVGEIVEVLDYPEARKPSYKLTISFGPEIGTMQSIGQFPANYTKDELIGKKVTCVVNFPRRQIGPAVSEALTLGFPDAAGHAVLITPDKEVPLGGIMF